MAKYAWWAIANFFRQHSLSGGKKLDAQQYDLLKQFLAGINGDYKLTDAPTLQKSTSKYLISSNLPALMNKNEEWLPQFSGFRQPTDSENEYSPSFLKICESEFKLHRDDQLQHSMATSSGLFSPQAVGVIDRRDYTELESYSVPGSLTLHQRECVSESPITNRLPSRRTNAQATAVTAAVAPVSAVATSPGDIEELPSSAPDVVITGMSRTRSTFTEQVAEDGHANDPDVQSRRGPSPHQEFTKDPLVNNSGDMKSDNGALQPHSRRPTHDQSSQLQPARTGTLDITDNATVDDNGNGDDEDVPYTQLQPHHLVVDLKQQLVAGSEEPHDEKFRQLAIQQQAIHRREQGVQTQKEALQAEVLKLDSLRQSLIAKQSNLDARALTIAAETRNIEARQLQLYRKEHLIRKDQTTLAANIASAERYQRALLQRNVEIEAWVRKFAQVGEQVRSAVLENRHADAKRAVARLPDFCISSPSYPAAVAARPGEAETSRR